MNIYYLIAFVSYFAFFLGVSFYFYRRVTTSSSFMLGNRQMNYWVTALSTQASDMSDWLFMAYPGLIYALGLFNMWVAIGLTFFMFLNWHFIAPRLRSQTEQYNSLTLASFFERKFGDTSGIIRLLTVFFTLYFIVFYIGAELIGLGRLFQTTFNIDYNLGIAISIALVVLNIILGGFAALAWSDMFRGLFLLAMIALVPIVALNNLSSPLLSSLNFSSVLSKTAHSLIPDYSWGTISSILLLSLGWGLGYFGSPHILINFMSIKDVNQMSKAKYVGITWQILVLAAATIVGLVGRIFFSTPLPNRELVFIEMVISLFNPLFAGFILCAILAATMSVMTAQIMATSSIIAEDFFKPLCGTISDRCSLLLVRICIIALPLLSYAVSYNSPCAVNDLVSYAWSGLGLSFAPTVIAALYIPFANKYGIIAAIALGGITGIIWPYLNFCFLPLLPVFIISMITLVAISLLTQNLARKNHA